MAKLFANSGDPDQTRCSVESDLGLHCLPIALLGVSRQQWVRWHMLLRPVQLLQVHLINFYISLCETVFAVTKILKFYCQCL